MLCGDNLFTENEVMCVTFVFHTPPYSSYILDIPKHILGIPKPTLRDSKLTIGDAKHWLGDPKARRGVSKPRLRHACQLGAPNQVPWLNV